MLLGLVMLALPLSIIGTNFIEERANMLRDKETEQENPDPKPNLIPKIKPQLCQL